MFNFYAPLNNRTSYGLVATNLIENFSQTCPSFPIGGQTGVVSKKMAASLMASRTFNANDPCVKLYHQFAMAEFIGKGAHIGLPIFELDKFNDLEEHHLYSLDGLIVTSKWAAGVVENNLKHVPDVVPLGVDRSIFHEVDYIPKSFVFFSAGKWEVRKSQDEIVESFNKGFEVKDNVELWMSFHNPFYPIEFIEKKKKEYKETKLGSKIKFVGPFETQNDLSRIMKMTSCGVFPSKAEGWGLETLEMMACGKPVIVTDYAGHTEYCDNKNSILLPTSGLVPAHDNKWFFGQGNWATFNIDDLTDSMKWTFKNGNVININGIETSKKFSWKNSAITLENIIEGKYK